MVIELCLSRLLNGLDGGYMRVNIHGCYECIWFCRGVDKVQCGGGGGVRGIGAAAIQVKACDGGGDFRDDRPVLFIGKLFFCKGATPRSA